MEKGKPANILMVDDRPENLVALAAVLKPLGSNLLSAESGQAALEVAQSTELAAVLLDVQMPGMDGFETARRLRQLQGARQLPIILITASEMDEAQILRGYELGAVDYVTKPFSPAAMRSKVSAYTGLFEHTLDLQEKLDAMAAQDTPHILVTNRGLAATLSAERFRDFFGKPVTIVLAPSGSEVLRQLLDRDFALLLLERKLPDMDGFDAAGLLRENRRCRHMPLVVVAAGRTSEADVARAYDLGAVDVLFSPVKPEYLFGKVKALLEQFWQQQVLAVHVDEITRLNAALQASARELAAVNATLEKRVEARTASVTRQHETEILAFFDQSLDLMCVANMDGRFEQVNPRFTDVLGYEPQEILARPYVEFVHPDDVAAVADTLAGLVEGIPTRDFKNRFRCKDGSYRTLLWSAAPQAEGGRIYASGRDVTASARREAERARLARIVEIAPDVIIVFQPDGRVAQINESARRLLATPASAVPPVSVTEFFELESAEVLRKEVIPRALSTGSWSGELSLCSPRGEKIETHVTVLSQPADLDGIAYLSILAHDVSAYKEVERIKDQFISTVSHELRTPLTSIRGSLGLVEAGVLGELAPKTRGMLRIAISNTDRLTRLINDVMDLEKMQAGRLVLHLEPLSLGAATAAAISEVDPIAKDARIKIVREFADPSPTVVADRDRVVQLVLNLLSNAVKFSPPNSAVKVKVSFGPTEGLAVVSVTDQGPGIPAEKLQQIFERFEQLDSSSTRPRGGTGLGLAIARDIAELHGGKLDVESTPGRGATFSFTIPVADAASATSTPEAVVQPGSRGRDLPAGSVDSAASQSPPGSSR